MSKEGIEMVLDNLPKLKVLHCCFLPHLLGELHGTALQRLRSSVNTLWMSLTIHDGLFLKLMQIEKLCEIKILSYEDFVKLTFNGEFVTLFHKFANTLTTLSLENVYKCPINIKAIVKYCPKLESPESQPNPIKPKKIE